MSVVFCPCEGVRQRLTHVVEATECVDLIEPGCALQTRIKISRRTSSAHSASRLHSLHRSIASPTQSPLESPSNPHSGIGSDISSTLVITAARPIFNLDIYGVAFIDLSLLALLEESSTSSPSVRLSLGPLPREFHPHRISHSFSSTKPHTPKPLVTFPTIG